jgi:pimeloyl-ACP methyl ester carboxylesterase
MPPVQLMRQVFDPPVYIVQLQDRGVAEWVLSWGRGARDFLELMFRSDVTRNAAAFPDDVIDVYAEAFAPSGAFTPPIEYYRNLDRNWELTADLEHVRIEVPCLMISAADTPAMTVGMEERVPNLRRVVIDDCGHWTQQERPEETTAAMLDYLKTLEHW